MIKDLNLTKDKSQDWWGDEDPGGFYLEDWECCVSIDVQDLTHYSADIHNFPQHLNTINLPSTKLPCSTIQG